MVCSAIWLQHGTAAWLRRLSSQGRGTACVFPLQAYLPTATGLHDSFKGRDLQLAAESFRTSFTEDNSSTGRAEGIFAWQMQI